MNPNRLKLLRRLRKQIKVHRHFTVELLEDGREKQTCKTCGHSEVKDIYPNINKSFQEKLVKYRNSGAGIYGVCKACSKVAADERYPIPKD